MTAFLERASWLKTLPLKAPRNRTLGLKTLRQFLSRILQVSATSLLLLLVAATWVRAQVESRLGDEGLRLGRSIFDSVRLANEGAAGPLSHHEFTLNGAQVHVESFTLHGHADTLIAGAIKSLRDECEIPLNDRTLEPLSAAEEDALKTLHFDSTTLLFGNIVLEGSGNGEQAFYCLKPAHALNLRGITAIARQFQDTRDLNDLGTWHGIYAKADEDSASFLTLEGHGPFQPELMFPPSGDAPGTDFETLPRPMGRRTLSISRNQETALNTYRSPMSLAESLSTFQEQLKISGLRVERPAQNGPQGNALLVRSSTASYVVSGSPTNSGSTLLIAALPD